MEAIPKEDLLLPERRKELHKEVEVARRNLAQQVGASRTFISEWRMKLCLRTAPENHLKERTLRGGQGREGRACQIMIERYMEVPQWNPLVFIMIYTNNMH